MQIRVKKVYNGLISLRDYQVNQAIARNVPLEVLYSDKKMTLTVEQLKEGKNIVPGIQKSRYGRDYCLIDYSAKFEDAVK